MITITIPKEIRKESNLIAVPKNLYWEFLVWQKEIKLKKTFIPSFTEKKALTRARKNFAKGKYMSFNELQRKLAANN